MTKKITDLEGRLAAALSRYDKPRKLKPAPLPLGASVIGRYLMSERAGYKPGELLFCKLIGRSEATPCAVEYVTWERDLMTGACFRGFYGEVFREVLRDFLTRIEQDGGR